MDGLIVIVFGIIVGILIIVAGYEVSRSERRHVAFQEVSTQLGLAFTANGDKALLADLSALPLFTYGHSKALTNLLQGGYSKQHCMSLITNMSQAS